MELKRTSRSEDGLVYFLYVLPDNSEKIHRVIVEKDDRDYKLALEGVRQRWEDVKTPPLFDSLEDDLDFLIEEYGLEPW